MKFTGEITEIREIKTGKTKKSYDWASLEFEVTERNSDYPQVGLFGYFKMGEYIKYAQDFNNYFKVGDAVDIEFNLKCQKYTKDGVEKKFYKTDCWKVEKVETVEEAAESMPSVEQPSNDDNQDLPF